MPYAASVRQYLRDLQHEYNAAVRGGQHTAELSYRPVLDRLFRNLAHDLNPTQEIDVVLEPRSQGWVGRPDWRIHDSVSLGIYGYVEAKGFSTDPFDTAPYQEQFDRYLTLGHKLVITDGIDFVFCMSQDAPAAVVSLVEKTALDRADWSTISPNPQFEAFMRELYANPSPQQCDEGKLVELVSIRTRLLAEDILKYASIPEDEAMDEEERQTIALLSGIRELVYNHNDSQLRTDRVFSDFTAQVIMFCLLYAHRVLCGSNDSPIQKEQKIREYVFRDLAEGETLLPFRSLMVYLRDHADGGVFIAQWVDECIKFLSFVQMTDYQLLNPDYHKLFELFLAKYDPKARFDYGAFYTPKTLANFVVRLSEKIVNQVFEGASIYENGNTIVDPCCGTGSFLEEIILNDPNDGAYNLCGFEILPTPYMLLNYRLSIIRRQHGVGAHTENIMLANTLCNGMFGEAVNESTIEGAEIARASVWAEMPLKLIIGNPPCSDSIRQNTDSEFSVINDLMDDFRPPITARRARQNIQKQINNPFMQFIRWSCEKLLGLQNNSALSLVVPLSFLEAESYRYARKYLIEHFSSIWVVPIDADARTGIRSNSLFRTLQGRAVIILTRKFGEAPGFREYQFVDFSKGSIAEKEACLNQDINQVIGQFRTYNIDANTLAFYPSKPFDVEKYNLFWPISDENGRSAVFMNHCSGIKLAPTALFTHIKAPMLRRRSRDIAAGGAAAAQEWFSGQDKPPAAGKVESFQAALNSCGNARAMDQLLNGNIAKYSFRPYLTSNVLLWEDVLKRYSTVGGGGTRLRPEIIKGFHQQGTIGFAMAHAPKDLHPTLSQFVSFCWYYPDNDMCTRGNSHIYMNRYYDKRRKICRLNVSPDLFKRLGPVLQRTYEEFASDMVFYAYAILCSQVYLDEFEGALFTVNQSDMRARIPMVADRDLFFQIRDLGVRLAELEKAEYHPENLLGFDYDAICSQIPRNFHLSNSPHPFDEENEELVLTDGTQTIKIPCPTALQSLNISGYDVVKNVWLKFHSYNFTHCDFTPQDAEKLLDFLNTLETRTRIVAEIDTLMPSVLKDGMPLISPGES